MDMLPKQAIFKNVVSKNALFSQTLFLALFLLAALPIVLLMQRANQRVLLDSASVAGLTVHFQGRHIDIDSGIVVGNDGRPVAVTKTSFDIGPCPGATHMDEPFLLVKPIENGTIDWQRVPAGIRSAGQAQPDALLPESLRVFSTERKQAVARLSRDEYFLEPKSGAIMASEINPRELEHVVLDYVVKRRRICTVVLLPSGKLAVVNGELSIARPAPPAIPMGAVSLVKIDAPPFAEQLSRGDFMPAQTGLTHMYDFCPFQLGPL
jgi:hypothetical protein